MLAKVILLVSLRCRPELIRRDTRSVLRHDVLRLVHHGHLTVAIAIAAAAAAASASATAAVDDALVQRSTLCEQASSGSRRYRPSVAAVAMCAEFLPVVVCRANVVEEFEDEVMAIVVPQVAIMREKGFVLAKV